MLETLTVRRNFLPEAEATELAQLYETATDWATEKQSFVYGGSHLSGGGKDKYQSFASDRLPTVGESYYASFDLSPGLTKHPAVLAAVAKIGGSTYRCYRMGPGQGFRVHIDDYFKGRFSHVLYLNRRWVWDWGGLLHVVSEDGQSGEVVFPEFNTLATMDYAEKKVPHFASFITSWAREPRYVLAIFGGTL
jgi:hypothetical protein